MSLDSQKRAALEAHWQASERGDSEVEHAIYGADAILDYPQSGERFRGRDTISAQRRTILPIATSTSSGSSAKRIFG